MQLFTRESFIQALKIIDANPELRKGRESKEYDLLYNGMSYPPILVISEANKIMGGPELTLNDFGNSTKKAFKIINQLGFEIINKETELTKNIVLDTIDLCQNMSDGRKNGTITKETYSAVFKPQLTQFQKKHGNSPALILQSQLKHFYTSQLVTISSKIEFKNFGFWGRSIYNYTWACIYYNFGNDSMTASFSPQLYILVNKDGIKFGFCYGHQIGNDSKFVQSALHLENLELLKKCLQNDRELCFFNATNNEVTARPEKLFGKDERITISSDDNIINNWSNNSLLIKEFHRNEIPENIGVIIQSTLNNLKEFYLSLLPINKKLEDFKNEKTELIQMPFSYKSFLNSANETNFKFSETLILRFVTSLFTKPFLICSGLSGSGKTKLAQAFAMWICENENQYCIVPVGADWTNREPLLGFPNALEVEKYVKPDNGVLDLIIEANKDENQEKPFFIILDEMNLSHVERYFADFLSVMESNNKIALHTGKTDWYDVPAKIGFPKNLFIIGTVNIDETTYMFSPKVLDRASVIEFRVTSKEMKDYLQSNAETRLDDLKSEGKNMAKSFVEMAKNKTIVATDEAELNVTLMSFFDELKKTGAEFGYRSASEILRFAAVVNNIEPTWSTSHILDAAIMQKLLPKVHGSRRKLEPILKTLGTLCLKDGYKFDEYLKNPENKAIKYPISLEKIIRMHDNLISNGFTSYAEA